MKIIYNCILGKSFENSALKIQEKIIVMGAENGKLKTLSAHVIIF